MNYKEMKSQKFAFVYLTTKTCNVCKVLQPKLRRLAENFAEATFHRIYLDENKDAASEFMAFAIPTFLVYSEGKELIRSARHMDIAEINHKLSRYYEMITEG